MAEWSSVCRTKSEAQPPEKEKLVGGKLNAKQVVFSGNFARHLKSVIEKHDGGHEAIPGECHVPVLGFNSLEDERSFMVPHEIGCV
eukprot:6271335-Amphidinium_carterae.2